MKINRTAETTATYNARVIGADKIFYAETVDFETYQSGGMDFDVEKYFPKIMHGVIIESKGGYTFDYDAENKKIKAYSAPGTEVEDGTDLSALTDVLFIAVGM